MTMMPSRSPGQAHGTVDGNLKRCRVLQLSRKANTVTLIDRFGSVFDVPLQYSAGGTLPAINEYWYLSNPFGRWCFLYKESPTGPTYYGQYRIEVPGTLTGVVGVDRPPLVVTSPFAVTLTKCTIAVSGTPSALVTARVFHTTPAGGSRTQIVSATIPISTTLPVSVPITGVTLGLNDRLIGLVFASTGNGKDLSIQIDYTYDPTVPS